LTRCSEELGTIYHQRLEIYDVMSSKIGLGSVFSEIDRCAQEHVLEATHHG
jgi:hypothetical protein